MTASEPSPRLRFASAAELFQAFPTAAQDISASVAATAPLPFMRGLAASDTPENAITFAAYLLTPREAVWWGHQCMGVVAGHLTADDHRLLALAEDWVREPGEAQRNAALEAGLDAQNKTPATYIALAAGWSGGSMQPPNQQPVPAPPYLAARAVNAGVLGALARVESGDRAATLAVFVDMAEQLVS